MKTVKLREYVKRCGSQEKAAREIGVSLMTVRRWLEKKDQPSGLAVHRLRELSIEV